MRVVVALMRGGGHTSMWGQLCWCSAAACAVCGGECGKLRSGGGGTPAHRGGGAHQHTRGRGGTSTLSQLPWRATCCLCCMLGWTWLAALHLVRVCNDLDALHFFCCCCCCSVLQAFNVAAMLLVRSTGAVATGLTMSCLVPVTVAAFTLPLPFLQPAPLGPHFMAGTVLLMFGLALFNLRLWWPAVAAGWQGWNKKWAPKAVDW